MTKYYVELSGWDSKDRVRKTYSATVDAESEAEAGSIVASRIWAWTSVKTVVIREVAR